jgi:hypothetical protein
MDNISRLKKELERAVLRNDIKKAEGISDKLFFLQGGREEYTVMPARFVEEIKEGNKQKTGGKKSMNMKKIISIVAAAAVITTIGITALATRWYGIRDLVVKNNYNPAAVAGSLEDAEAANMENGREKADLIVLQGYPDSNEYKASAEWNMFCDGYDTDGSLLSQVGNRSNEYTEKYPLYLVYTKEMADKLEEIVQKYGLTLHESMTIVGNEERLIEEAGTEDFIKDANTVLGGYVYNDGTFQFDGEAVLKNSKHIDYQFGNYVKGTFSDTYLNIGDADAYTEWAYKTGSGVSVSLALGDGKALVIADLPDSYVVINVLSGREQDITAEMLQEFADSFDFSKIK